MVALNSLSTLLIAAGLSLYFEWRLALVALLIVPLILLGTYFETKFSQMDTYGSKNAVENAAKVKGKIDVNDAMMSSSSRLQLKQYLTQEL